MKLLIEHANEQDVEYITENTSSGKKMYLEGKWAAVDEEVKNGRTYARDIMESALSNYKTNYIDQKRALGEVSHPQGPQINLDRVSHIIESLRIDHVGGKSGVYGRARIIEATPMGTIAKALLEAGVRVGVSTRGLGSIVERSGRKYVGNDFVLSAIDLVSDPSGPGCFPSAISESIEYEMLEDGRIVQLMVDKAKKKINEEVALKQFAQLMREFKTK